jgi:hypothetical protein
VPPHFSIHTLRRCDFDKAILRCASRIQCDLPPDGSVLEVDETAHPECVNFVIQGKYPPLPFGGGALLDSKISRLDALGTTPPDIPAHLVTGSLDKHTPAGHIFTRKALQVGE